MIENDDWSGWDDGADDRIGRKRDRLARLLSVASILFSKGSGESGVPVAEIARLTGMTTRTVYRDIRALEDELGVPVFQAGRGRYGIDRKFFLPPLRLTVPEAIVLFLASRLIARWSDQYDAAVVSSFTKLADALPQPIARHVTATMLAVGAHDPNEPFSRTFSAVARGWAEGRVVEIVYDPGTGAEKRTRVHPYVLEPDAALRSVYLIGFDEPADAMRTYKVERIRSATLTQDRYEIPEDFDPDRVAGELVGDLVLRLDTAGARAAPLRALGRSSRARGDLASVAGAGGARRGRGRAGRDGGRHRRDPAVDPVVGRGGGGPRAGGSARGDRRLRAQRRGPLCRMRHVRPAGSGSSPAVRS